MFSPIRTQRIPSTVARSFFRFNSASSHSARRFDIGKCLITGAAAGVAGGGTLLVASTHKFYIVIYSVIHPLPQVTRGITTQA